jgi:squalene-hopene/tetraprenyl-beta-curcumene cyclase
MMDIDKQAFDKTLRTLTGTLKDKRHSDGHWQGNLSSSALSTATAVFALAKVDREKYKDLIEQGLRWLADTINEDGGWGDTDCSISNISTTMLCWSAFTVACDEDKYKETIQRTRQRLESFAGNLEPEKLAEAVNKKYGKDRTFSAPILTMCALAYRIGETKQAWKLVKPLPFELAACPHQFFNKLHLKVVSYALPALIAIGQVNFFHQKPKNLITRCLRALTRRRTLKVLENIQPENGGFLAAVSLTSFVMMSLASSGQAKSKVVKKGVDFLLDSVRQDGSWPIDTNLATWVSTLSINAFAGGGDIENILSTEEREKLARWLLDQQFTDEHPYTHAAGGGWAWTNEAGGVPDADDTAGALLALKNLNVLNIESFKAAAKGIEWLLGIQNNDGGIPTFCRGWSAMPFDRSSSDLTAHAIAAWDAWLEKIPSSMQVRVEAATERALDFLANIQNSDGSWLALWFGNQYSPNHENFTYGTGRVLICLGHVSKKNILRIAEKIKNAADLLLSIQNPDGGWGGAKDVVPCIEETAIAVNALTVCLNMSDKAEFDVPVQKIKNAICKGTSWLIKETDQGQSLRPSPIGLYFAKLWYYERLYPLIFSTAALMRLKQTFKTF